jgi:hypothetical protein
VVFDGSAPCVDEFARAGVTFPPTRPAGSGFLALPGLTVKDGGLERGRSFYDSA